MSDLNSNFNVPAPAGISVVVKKIDETVNSGVVKDPVADSMSKIMNPPMPREGMRQFPLSGKQAPSAPTKGYQDDNR